jgi:hypothetical protein
MVVVQRNHLLILYIYFYLSIGQMQWGTGKMVFQIQKGGPPC